LFREHPSMVSIQQASLTICGSKRDNLIHSFSNFFRQHEIFCPGQNIFYFFNLWTRGRITYKIFVDTENKKTLAISLGLSSNILHCICTVLYMYSYLPPQFDVT
jgi:hypothetical protein